MNSFAFLFLFSSLASRSDESAEVLTSNSFAFAAGSAPRFRPFIYPASGGEAEHENFLLFRDDGDTYSISFTQHRYAE
jgi:hypothetical protein